MKLSSYMKNLRENRRKSLAEVANVTGMQRATVWKVENGHLPKTGTLKKILEGLGIGPRSKHYKEAVALWTNERMEKDMFEPAELSSKIAKQRRMSAKEIDEFVESLSALSSQEFAAIVLAAKRPEVLRALNAIYESK